MRAVLADEAFRRSLRNCSAIWAGWKNYFQLQQSLSLFQGLDGWIRHRLRMLQLKHWKNAATANQALCALSLTEAEAAKVAGNLKSWLRNSEQGSAAQVIRRPGAAEASDVTSTLRTAGCGPARPVVWEGPGGAIASASLYPITAFDL